MKILIVEVILLIIWVWALVADNFNYWKESNNRRLKPKTKKPKLKKGQEIIASIKDSNPFEE